MVARNEIPDYQVSAWLMAACLSPLNEDETASLTVALANSGVRLDLTGLPAGVFVVRAWTSTGASTRLLVKE